MDLKNFIKQTVRDIVKAAEELEPELDREIYTHSHDNKNIEFDLAVTVENKKGKSGEGSIKIWQFASGKGNLNSEYKNITTSRIQFSLRIDSKTKKEWEEKRKQIEKQHTNR